MRKLLILAALLVPTLLPAATRLLRQPTYLNGKIAFSYLGDIWVAREDGSDVRRLTDNRARDVYPRFSPDGNWIAFSSNRAGNYDVFVIPAAGGAPRQLTFHSADDTVVGWTPDSRQVLFTSTRGAGAFPTVPNLYLVAVTGGLEQQVPTDWGSWASYSPDGARLAFSRHNSPWWRKHYRGSFAWDLWVMDVAARRYTRLSGNDDFKGNWLFPMYGRGGEIYFVCDRLPSEKNVKPGSPEVMKSVNNIWKIPERGGAPVQVTHHTSGNLFYPSISADGRAIVYEENFGLWKLDTATGKTREISVSITADPKENVADLRTFQNEADSFSLSPSSKRAAISTHGEIFSIATDRGEARRITETPWREEAPAWSPNGKWVAFTSDRTGRQEIWLADEFGEKLKKLTGADTEKTAMTWSPDSRWLAYTSSDHKLWRVDVESGKSETIASSDVQNLANPQFSPDGKWVSYTKTDQRLRPHVYVNAAAGGAERLVESDDLFAATGARWTPDGKKLLLLAGVTSLSVASQSRPNMQLFSVALTREEKNPLDRDVDSEEEAAQAPAPAGRMGRGGSDAGNGARPKPDVKIEWDGLERRIRQITRVSDSISAVVPSPDSRTYAFVAFGGGETPGAALYTISEDGERMTRIASGRPPSGDEAPARGRFGGGISNPQWAKDGRSIYYESGGGIYSISVPEAPAANGGTPAGGRGAFGRMAAAETGPASASAQPRRVTFTVRMEIDQEAERKQVFEEAWRIMKDRFYDAKMHGADWAAMKDTYEPLLANLADGEELRTVILQMIGEMNASHTGMTAGRGPGEEDRVQTRYPGFDLQPDAAGYYKVSYIYKKGPADHDYVKLAPGNYILAVNGRELKTADNYWRDYNLIPGRKFEFLVNSKPAKDGAWTVKLEPLNSMAFGNLMYERWVDQHKALVDKLSSGQVGYLHIRAMDAPSLRKFERDLAENRFKKALIIDERFNGGGGIDQELLEILSQRRQYQATRGRDSVLVDRPSGGYFGPMVVLQNERSASDAEMFPDGFRTLGLGKIVGVPTYGAVIGTGAYRMLDGSSLRTPSFGVYTARGVNMENYGVPPDVYVDNTPDDYLAGRDSQIARALALLK